MQVLDEQQGNQLEIQNGGDGWLKNFGAKVRGLVRRKKSNDVVLKPEKQTQKKQKPAAEVLVPTQAINEREPLLPKENPVSQKKRRGLKGLFRGPNSGRQQPQVIRTPPVRKSPPNPEGYSAYKRSVEKYTKDEFDLFDTIYEYDMHHGQNNLIGFINSILDWLEHHSTLEKSMKDIHKCRNIKLFQFIRNFFTYLEEQKQLVASNRLSTHMPEWFSNFFGGYIEKGITDTVKAEIGTTLLLAYMTWYQGKYTTDTSPLTMQKKIYMQVSKYLQKNVDSLFIDSCANMYTDYLKYKCEEFKKCVLQKHHVIGAKNLVLRTINEFVLFDKLSNYSDADFSDNFFKNIKNASNFVMMVYELAKSHNDTLKTQRKTQQKKTQRKTYTRGANQSESKTCRDEDLNEFISRIMVDENGNDENPNKYISKLPFQEQINDNLFAICVKLLLAYLIWYENVIQMYTKHRQTLNKLEEIIPDDKTYILVVKFFAENKKNIRMQNIITKCNDEYTESNLFSSSFSKENMQTNINVVNANIAKAHEDAEKLHKAKKGIRERIMNPDIRFTPKTHLSQESVSLEEANKLLELAKSNDELATKLFGDADKLYKKIADEIGAVADKINKNDNKLEIDENAETTFIGVLDDNEKSAIEIKEAAESLINDKLAHLLKRKAVLLLTISSQQTSPIAQPSKKKTSRINITKKQKKTATVKSMPSESDIQIRQIADEVEKIANTINETASKISFLAVSAKNCIFNAKQAYDVTKQAYELAQQAEDLKEKLNTGESMNTNHIKQLAINSELFVESSRSIIGNMSNQNKSGAAKDIVYQPETDAKKKVEDIAGYALRKLLLTKHELDELLKLPVKNE